MIAGSFANVGTKAKYSLADLSVAGYEAPYFDPDDECFYGGCAFDEFQLKVLDSSGTATATYQWLDFKDGESEQVFDVYGPGWYVKSGKVYTPLTKAQCEAIVFDQGQSFWTLASGYKLVSAGQVTPEDVAKSTNKKGHSAIGNGMPMELSLGELTVTGYDEPYFDPDDECFYGGCAFDEFQLKVLNSSGTATATYQWLDFKDGESEEVFDVYGPGWYVKEGKTYTPLTKAQSDAIKFPAGQGFWVLGSGYKLVLPAPEL